MFPEWQSNSRSNASTFLMSSLYYLDLICVSAFWSQCNRSAHASVSGSGTLTESEQEIAFISDFVRVSDMSLQHYLPNITNESEHIFINPQAKEPTLCKKFLVLVELDGCHFEVAPPLSFGKRFNPQRCFIYYYETWKVEKRWLIYRPTSMKGLMHLDLNWSF